MILKKGESYRISGLRHVGWTRGDDSGHEGYDLWDYFSGDFAYLGPDMHGIEPVFDDEQDEPILSEGEWVEQLWAFVCAQDAETRI